MAWGYLYLSLYCSVWWLSPVAVLLPAEGCSGMFNGLSVSMNNLLLFCCRHFAKYIEEDLGADDLEELYTSVSLTHTSLH